MLGSNNFIPPEALVQGEEKVLLLLLQLQLHCPAPVLNSGPPERRQHGLRRQEAGGGDLGRIVLFLLPTWRRRRRDAEVPLLRRRHLRLLLLLRDHAGENVSGAALRLEHLFWAHVAFFFNQHPWKVRRRRLGGEVFLPPGAGVLPVRRQLLVRRHHGQVGPQAGRGQDQELLLCGLLPHLSGKSFIFMVSVEF